MQTPELKILIKKITSKYIKEVCALENLCFNTPWSKEQFQDAINSPVYCFIGAFKKDNAENKILLAYLLVAQVGDYAEIINIASHPMHRRKGLGKALLNEFFKEKTIEEIAVETILEVRSKNIAAQNLYKQFNFIPIYTRKNYYLDDDALVMQRKL